MVLHLVNTNGKILKGDYMITGLIISVLVTYGITNILVNSHLFSPITNLLAKHSHICFIRWMHELLSCMMCTGFWIGGLTCWLLGLHIIAPMWLSFLLMGGLLSGTTWIIHCIVSALGGGYDPSITLNVLHEDISDKE